MAGAAGGKGSRGAGEGEGEGMPTRPNAYHAPIKSLMPSMTSFSWSSSEGPAVFKNMSQPAGGTFGGG